MLIPVGEFLAVEPNQIFDILKKEIELLALRQKNVKSLVRLAIKELKQTDSTVLLGPKFQIVSKKD